MFGTGDVVGCGIDWTEKKNGEGVIFFTLNGLRLGKYSQCLNG